MLFNSFHFLVFFIVVTTLYFASPYSRRWLLLLVASCYFYMAFVPVYILILGFTIVIDYFSAIFIENATGRKRKMYLIFSLIANISVLAFFKYFNFLNENLKQFLNFYGYENHIPYLSILLPIGLSFHTFQAMSYTIEVYRGKQKAERHFGIYSLYVMFYPQLVAGPIERPQNLIHQFREKYAFDSSRLVSGLKLIIWGLFKKVVIADRLAMLVDPIFNNPGSYDGLSLLIATIFFSFQIFCDFSGYSDMAIGIARVMGFKLMKNFDNPYISKSIGEFWKRWHISLSTWFKDYVYIPLGGNKVSTFRLYTNLMFVFLVSGLWHGANWTFIVWGAIHAFYLIFGLITKKIRERSIKFIRLEKRGIIDTFVTFFLVAFAWIFFRALNVGDALSIVSKIFTEIPGIASNLIENNYKFQFYSVSKFDIILSVILIIFLQAFHYSLSRFNILEKFYAQPRFIRWAGYYGVIFCILFLGVFEKREFIYFQF
jgi:alginate O-acetyltransferase complex protein AlgI